MKLFTPNDLRERAARLLEDNDIDEVADVLGKSRQALGQAVKRYDSPTKYMALTLTILAHFDEVYSGPTYVKIATTT